MQRKDVRIGMVIGGILVAVLIVALLIPGKNNKHNGPGAELASAGDPAAPATGAPQLADGRTDAPPPPTTSPAELATARDNKPGGVGDPFKSSTADPSAKPDSASAASPEDKWMMALNKGVISMMSPAPNPNSGKPQPSSAAAPTGEAASAGGSSAPPEVLTPAANSAATVVPPANTAGNRTHIVQPGETISKIALVAYGSQNYWPYIKRANPNVDPNKIKPGMTLILPSEAEVKGATSNSASPVTVADTSSAAAPKPARAIDSKTEYQVEPGDSLNKIATKLYGNSQKWEAIYELNKETIGPDPAKVKVKSILKLPEPPTVK